MKKFFIAAVLVSALSSASHAAVGIFGSYIGINANGAGNSWYGAQQWGANTIQNFGSANLGTFDLNTGSLTISGYQVQTFKSGGGDITGANLYYRVYQQSTTPGGFNTVNAGFIANAPFTSAAGNSASGGGDQNWGQNPTGNFGNLLGGLTLNAVYNVEIYFDATSNEGTQFSNNGGANYIATFTAVPEPSTYALLAMGAAAFGGYVIRRRRRVS
ncbi:MAG: PEP-CTERM sorting domain-containing protein [Chthoniobacterales bacterium]